MEYAIDLEISVTEDEIRRMVAEKVNLTKHHRLPIAVEPEDVTIQPDGSAVIQCRRQCKNETAWWAKPNQLTPEEQNERAHR